MNLIQRSPHLQELKSEYLFPQIAARKGAFHAQMPGAELVNLGIGDTSLPLPDRASVEMARFAKALATKQGYRGYGPEQGEVTLRKRIAEKIYKGAISPDEIFIGDGTKCDIARLQVLFGPHAVIGVQDPTYPAYRDSAILTNGSLLTGGERRVRLLPCSVANGYFPDLEGADPNIDALFFCSPNNPTGYTATRDQLRALVSWALEHRAVVVFDAAYSAYIADEAIPRSIFEIEGATECAIELNSFSKMAGFTGVRLSWSVVPSALVCRAGKSLHESWLRIHTTLFNGASNIAQAGGLACLSAEGLKEVDDQISKYRLNAQILRRALTARGLDVVGGEHAPYLWVHFQGRSSWDIFDHFLSKLHLVCTPGSGFGACGEGHIRLSALGSCEDVIVAAKRLRQMEFVF